MFYADSLGLQTVERALEGFARNDSSASTDASVAPLLARLAAQGKTFN